MWKNRAWTRTKIAIRKKWLQKIHVLVQFQDEEWLHSPRPPQTSANIQDWMSCFKIVCKIFWRNLGWSSNRSTQLFIFNRWKKLLMKYKVGTLSQIIVYNADFIILCSTNCYCAFFVTSMLFPCNWFYIVRCCHYKNVKMNSNILTMHAL